MTPNVSCNLCGADDAAVVGTRDRRGRDLRTVSCLRCGLVYSNPRPEEEVVRRYYATQYRQQYKGTTSPTPRQLLKGARGAVARWRALHGLLAPGARILDVGSGGGELVYLLRRTGYDARGVEPDEGYARHARDTLGLPIDIGFLQDVALPAAGFDLITMYHALEHVEDPSATAARLAGCLAPGGRWLVEVPNVESRCEDPARRYHFAHFYNFSPATLEALGRKAGMDAARRLLSPDGGNLTIVFGKPVGGPGHRDWRDGLREAGEATRALLAGQSRSAYYLTPRPYARAAARLFSYLEDSRQLTCLPREGGRALLDAFFDPAIGRRSRGA